jgi:hypothetical protein
MAISSEVRSIDFTFGAPEKFSTVEIEAPSIVKILDIVDSDGNIWYEVPYLAQDFVFDSTNTIEDPYFTSTLGEEQAKNSPKLLRLKKVPTRFVSRFINENVLQIQFGAGISENDAAEVTPNPNNIGIGLPNTRTNLTTAFSPTNFTYTDTYGLAPSNTTLTVRYLTGGGVAANVPSNTITQFDNTSQVVFNQTAVGLDPVLSTYIQNSLAVNNPKAASGGGDGDTINEIRFNSLNSFQTQLRSVTQEDYLIRALSLPSEFGDIAKVYTEPQKVENILPGELPSILDMYVLAYDNNKKLKIASSVLKQNLITYLSQYRVINDSISIRDAFIINIGIDFEVITLPNVNNNQILANCITALQDYFNIDKWQINQPIILREIYILLDKIEGIQTVKNVSIVNKGGQGDSSYSIYAYDIEGATKNGVIYPSLDASIFEVKFPNVDIKGRIANF